MEFSEKVKYAREALKLSQEKFAIKLGVSFATVNRWEKGHTLPTYEAQKRFDGFCKIHDINVEE